jgi:hypothetical protein
MSRIQRFIMVVASIWLVVDASAQTVNVTPAKGQSSEQMQRDMAECQGLATQSTGYNPAAAQPSNSTAETQRGGRLRGATTGAVAGAAAAEVRGNRNEEIYDNATHEQREDYRRNQAASTATAGAVIGGSRQRRDRRAQKNAASQANPVEEAYAQAYSGCLLGRNYTVSP